jgi:homoserine kinase type II
MAVYTQLSAPEIQALAERVGIGRVTSFEGVAAGVENTTYFLRVENSSTTPTIPSEYVLTVAETISATDLHFIAELSALLSRHNLPVPTPLRASTGAVFMLANKPALVVPKIPGTHPIHPTVAQCNRIGAALGHLHQVTTTAKLQHPSHRSLNWVAATGMRLLSCLAPTERALLAQEVAFLEAFAAANTQLPQGVIHGDLFCDNALFLNDNLTAIIDFFSAGTGFLLLDLAIAANNWCRLDDTFLPAQLHALSAGYTNARSPSPAEMNAWPHLLRIGALRFWVSRLAELHFGDAMRPPGQRKDPDEYRRLLLQHRDNPLQWIGC